MEFRRPISKLPRVSRKLYAKNDDFDNQFTMSIKDAVSDYNPISWMVYLKVEEKEDLVLMSYYDMISNYIEEPILSDDTIEEYADTLAEIYNTINPRNDKDIRKLFYDFIRYVFNTKYGDDMESTEKLDRKAKKEYSNLVANIWDIALSLIKKLDIEKDDSEIPVSGDQYNEFIETMDELYTDSYNYDVANLEYINEIHKSLSSVNISDRFEFSSNKVISRSYTSSAKYDGKPVITSLGPTIFDDMIISQRVPYAKYVGSNDQVYHKIYSGSVVDTKIDYDRIFKKKKKRLSTKTDVIEFVMCLGEGDIYSAILESFMYVSYDVANNVINYTVTSTVGKKITMYEEKSMSVIRECFSSLVFNEFVESSITVEFNLYPKNFEFLEFEFLDMIFSNETISSMIECDERLFTYARKIKYDYQYIPLMSDKFLPDTDKVSWTMRYQNLIENEEYPIYEGGDTDELYTTDVITETYGDIQKYIVFRITKAKSTDDAEFIKDILLRLLCIYNDERDNVGMIYKDNIEDLVLVESIRKEGLKGRKALLEETEITLPKAKKKDKTQTNRERLDTLRSQYPDIFIPMYETICTLARTPIAFTSENAIVDWISENPIIINDVAYDRPYLPFPYGKNVKTRFWFTSVGDKYVYPTVMKNTDKNTMKSMPYLPCTSDSDQSKISSSAFNIYYEGIVEYVKPRKDIISTNKFLKPGDKGKLPTSLNMYLGRYSNANIENTNEIIVRRGVCAHPSPNSLIHCVLFAVNDPNAITFKIPTGGIPIKEYNKIAEQQEEYAKKVRLDLLKKVSINACKQETYGFSEKEIKRKVKDVDSFFESKIFYRLLEEYYHINIFVFESASKEAVLRRRKKSSKESQSSYISTSEEVYFEIPRHKIFCSRVYRPNRPTVILYKNHGTTKTYKLNQYPQYEVIMDATKPRSLHQLKMTELCYNLHTSCISTVTFIRNQNNVKSYNDIYMNINYEYIFKKSIISQHIDSYGKVYAFNIQLENDKKATMFVYPTQPLNLPINKKVYESNVKDIESIFEDRIKGITKNKNGDVNGVWVMIYDIEYCIYIPVTINAATTKKYSKFPNIPQTLHMTTSDSNKESEIDKHRKNERLASYIRQLLIWMFDVWRRSQKKSSKKLATKFCKEYITLVDSDSGHKYDFSLLKSLLPEVKSIDQCIKHISSHSSGFIVDGKVAMYSMTMYDRICKMIYNYMLTTFLLTPEPKRSIDGYYTYYLDFKQQDSVFVFANDHDFNMWFQDWIREDDISYIVRNKIDMEYADEINPYIYQKADGDHNMYLIQNIEDVAEITEDTQKLTRKRAITVANCWNKNNINLGYNMSEDTVPYNGNVVTNMVGITKDLIQIYFDRMANGEYVTKYDYGDKKEIPIKDRDNYIEILRYAGQNDLISGKSRHAAMLNLV